MPLIRTLVLLAVWIGNAAALAQSPIHEEFQTGDLDWSVWCPCQINMIEAPITFPLDQDQAGDRVALLTADDASLGGNKCRSNAPDFECRPPTRSATLALLDVGEKTGSVLDLPEPLGPSLIRPRGYELAEASPRNPYCTEEVERRAKAAGEEGCIQRQELRFHKRYRHDVNDPRLYSVRFRMPERIEDRTSSIRWVLAQWKQEPISEEYCRHFDCATWGPSPFLALRFDDGVLHVTVQDEHCRCKVASAPFPDGSKLDWADGPPQYCVSSDPREPDGSTCTPDLDVQYGTDPILTPPLGRWIEMRIRVEADRARRAVIQIHQDDRFIVRVAGKIGYEQARGSVSKTKFKIGHYRDYMPFVHAMEIDWLTVAPVTE